MRPPATRAGAPGPGSTTPMSPAETSITPRSLGNVSASPVGSAGAGVGPAVGAWSAGGSGFGARSVSGRSLIKPILFGLRMDASGPRVSRGEALSRRARVAPLQVGQESLHLPDPLV